MEIFAAVLLIAVKEKRLTVCQGSLADDLLHVSSVDFNSGILIVMATRHEFTKNERSFRPEARAEDPQSVRKLPKVLR